MSKIVKAKKYEHFSLASLSMSDTLTMVGHLLA